jgi:hypothetical protein
LAEFRNNVTIYVTKDEMHITLKLIRVSKNQIDF